MREQPIVDLPPAATPSAAVTDIAPSPAGFGSRAASGFALGIATALICRVVSFGGQIAIAWYLSKHDFGVAAIAVSAAMLISLVREVGISQFLLRYPARFESWAADAFWLSTALGVLGSLLVVAAIPLVSRWTHEPDVVGPMLVMAVTWTCSAVSTVSGARMRIDLRFAAFARLAMLSQLGATVLGIALAAGGAGPYAVVFPLFSLIVVASVFNIVCAPPAVRLPVAWSRWRVMLLSGWPITLGAVSITLITQGASMILGLHQDAWRVGVFYFALQISSQLQTQLGDNLASVVAPVFGHLGNDPGRQRQAFVRSCRLLCLIGMPLFFLQASLIDPLLHLIWRDKWADAVLPAAFLSIGMSFRLLNSISVPLMYSQGRQRLHLALTFATSVVFILLLTVVSRSPSAWAVPLVAAGCYVVGDTIYATATLTDWRRGMSSRRAWADLASAVLPSLAIGTAVAAVVWPLSQAVQPVAGHAAALVLGGIVGLGVHHGLFRVFQPAAFAELSHRVADVSPKVARLARRFGVLARD